jgi:CRISPR-associated endonuclease/helicase Cas3
MKGARRDYTDPAPLADRLRDDLGRMGMGPRVRLEVGRRQVVKVKGVLIVGYEVGLSRLNPRESLVIQAAGLGGRRRFGCGVFVPC